MSKPAAVINLSPEEESTLRQWLRAGTTEQRMTERAQIVLLASQGQSTLQIAAWLQTRPARVSKWRQRFAQRRLEGLHDGWRSGKPRRYDASTEKRVLKQLDQPSPVGHPTWTGHLLAQALGDVSEDQVWRVLRRQGISLRRRRSWCISTDPAFAPKAADILGLYLHPPQHAAVFCVEEKTAIQALNRLDPVLPLSPGRAERHGFEYYRHGTLSLYAALNSATGRVHGKTAARHTSREFVAFLQEVLSLCPPRQQIHIILDNLSAHKTRAVHEFLQQHPRVQFHFTPTYSSWLNQVESWFAKIEREVIARGIFTSVSDLARKLRRYINAYSANAQPIHWKYSDPTRRVRSNELTATSH